MQIALWSFITILAVLGVAVIYLVLKDVAKRCAIVSRQIHRKTVGLALLIVGLSLVFFNPTFLPHSFWMIFALAWIGLGLVVYPVLTVILTWQNRHNPEELKRLKEEIDARIANTEKHGQ